MLYKNKQAAFLIFDVFYACFWSVNQQCMVKRISKDTLVSSIDHVCKDLQATLGLLTSTSDSPLEALKYVSTQVELLLCLTKHIEGSIPSPMYLVILKTCTFGMKKSHEFRLSGPEIEKIFKSFLMLLHLVVDITSNENGSELICEVANNCLGILPILCTCTEIPDQSIVSLATIDIIIKKLLQPTTWLPIIKQFLQLQQIVLKLHDKKFIESLPVIMKFLLTLASVRGGAEMIVASGFPYSLRSLFGNSLNEVVPNWGNPETSPKRGPEIAKPQFVWGLGLAVLSETICSLGETSLCKEVVDSMISYFLCEKVYLITYHLSPPDFPSEDHDKKRARARAQKRHISLSSFRETEYTLMLLCILAKYRNSWVKATQEIGSELRGRIIHLLAFISRSHRLSESASQPAPLLCPPLSKEENEYCKEPSFINSKNGWFGGAALGCVPVSNINDEYSQTAIVIKDYLANGNANSVKPTYFSDIVAIEIYKITFLILKFLILQAKDAVERAEELGFIDLSHFPELPDPEILHCLQVIW